MREKKKDRKSWTQRLKRGLSVSHAEFCHILTLHFIINGCFFFILRLTISNCKSFASYSQLLCIVLTTDLFFALYLWKETLFQSHYICSLSLYTLCFILAHSLFHSLLIHNLACAKSSHVCVNGELWKKIQKHERLIKNFSFLLNATDGSFVCVCYFLVFLFLFLDIVGPFCPCFFFFFFFCIVIVILGVRSIPIQGVWILRW